ncbi:MAG TPA: hypothetical protein PKC14_00665 [Candidatus Absconditabacterales bacterium]|nr:hypothetical protein [Candidatus Absconditabacterales bacterium]
MFSKVDPDTTISSFLLSILRRTDFEFDKSVNQRVATISGLAGYYGQGDTKNQAFSNLIEIYLDTFDLQNVKS